MGEAIDTGAVRSLAAAPGSKWPFSRRLSKVGMKLAVIYFDFRDLAQ